MEFNRLHGIPVLVDHCVRPDHVGWGPGCLLVGSMFNLIERMKSYSAGPWAISDMWKRDDQ